jgi:hypothetical protein
MKKITFIFSLLLLFATAKTYGQNPTDLDRTGLTVITETANNNYEYVPDGNTGLPAHLLDGDPATFLSLVKPGKSYGTVGLQPSDFKPGFIIDMQTAQTFNYFNWTHRNHANNILRVFAIRMAVSDDGFIWTSINNNQPIWIPNIGGYVGQVQTVDPDTYLIGVPETTAQYVKITYDMWSDIYNSDHPDYPGTGATSGSTLQVGEFGLGYSPTSGLDDITVSSDTVVAVKYYTLLGREVVRPTTTGIYIVRNTHVSGRVTAIKQLIVVK